MGILDPQVLFEQAPELQGAKVDRPDAVVNLLEADVLPNAGDAHVDPPPVPPDPAIGADVAGLEVGGIRERGEAPRHRARRGTRAGRGGGEGEGLAEKVPDTYSNNMALKRCPVPFPSVGVSPLIWVFGVRGRRKP